jgi:serine/threonine protein phosphatase 1
MELLLGGRCNSVISGIDRVVLGHTPMRGDWLQQGNLCWLDTGATYHGHLTLLCDEELLASQPFT